MSEFRKPSPIEAQPRREKLSDAEIGDLLAAIGNHEGKALLLIAMQANQPYTRGQLRSLVRNKQGEQDKWKGMSHTIPFKWCEDSLAPIGLVAQEIVDPEKGIVGYMKTEKGEEFGAALAGHLLGFSERHSDISLSQLFGSTQSNSDCKIDEKPEDDKNEGRLRAPITRLRIFTELVTADLPIRGVDVVQSFMDDYPGEYNYYSNTMIMTNLQKLSENKVIEAVGRMERHTEIQLAGEQRDALTDLVTIIEKFRDIDSEFIQEGKKKAEAIALNPERFARLLEKAKNFSSAANKTDQSETARQLKRLIGKSASSRESLQRAFFEQYGRRLGEKNIHAILRNMHKTGEVEVIKKGNKNYYSIAAEEGAEPADAAPSESPDSPSSSLTPSGTVFER